MVLWVIITGFALGFGLAFSIGANDVANSFGTSVGSKVLTLRKACILASIFETAGSVLIGAKVSSTISKGIIDIDMYTNDVYLLELGYLASLLGSFVWLIVATLLKLPVSGTHSIVGAVIGFALVAKGAQGITWMVLVKIVSSWFISPMMSGIISSAIYFSLQYTILQLPEHKQQLERGILLLPLFYAVTIGINAFSVFYDGPQMLYFHLIPLWGAFIASLGIGLVSAVLARLIIAPRLKQEIIGRRATLADLYRASKKVIDAQTSVNELDYYQSQQSNRLSRIESFNTAYESFLQEQRKRDNDGDQTGATNISHTSLAASVHSLILMKPFTAPGDVESLSAAPSQPNISIAPTELTEAERRELEYPGIFKLFTFLQVLTACFGAFAHGGNDVSNAVGPVIGLYGLYQGKAPASTEEPELWIFALGGVAISLGLWVLGRRVIETVGSDLTKLTPPSGFSIELGAAMTVLLASQVSVPISTTHCKIGSVVLVGISRGGRKEIDWSIFRNIVLAWVITVPASGIVSAAVMFLLKLIAFDPYATTHLLFDSSLNVTNLTTTTLFYTALDSVTTTTSPFSLVS